MEEPDLLAVASWNIYFTEARGSLAAGSISTRAAECGHRLRMQGGAVIREAAEDHPADRRRASQRIDCCRHRDPRRAIGGETIDTGGDGGKGDRSKPVALAQLDRAGIARRQRFILALGSTSPDRTDGVNHMPCRKPITAGDLGAAGLAAMECPALGQKLRPGRAMDRPIDAATAAQ